jgi:hypothetical protein
VSGKLLKFIHRKERKTMDIHDNIVKEFTEMLYGMREDALAGIKESMENGEKTIRVIMECWKEIDDTESSVSPVEDFMMITVAVAEKIGVPVESAGLMEMVSTMVMGAKIAYDASKDL